jgi:hypothetical protein
MLIFPIVGVADGTRRGEIGCKGADAGGNGMKMASLARRAMAEQTDALTSSHAFSKVKLYILAGLKARSNGH